MGNWVKPLCIRYEVDHMGDERDEMNFDTEAWKHVTEMMLRIMLTNIP